MFLEYYINVVTTVNASFHIFIYVDDTNYPDINNELQKHNQTIKLYRNVPNQWKRHDALQPEASCSINCNRGNNFYGLPFRRTEYRKGVPLKGNKASGRDYVLVEQFNKIGPVAHKWLLTMLHTCYMKNRIPTIWRQSKIIAILEPGKDSAIPKNYRSISLLCIIL